MKKNNNDNKNVENNAKVTFMLINNQWTRQIDWKDGGCEYHLPCGIINQ